MADHETTSGAVSLTRPVPNATVGAVGTGGSVSPETVIETVAGAESTSPSLAVKVKASGPA